MLLAFLNAITDTILSQHLFIENVAFSFNVAPSHEKGAVRFHGSEINAFFLMTNMIT